MTGSSHDLRVVLLVLFATVATCVAQCASFCNTDNYEYKELTVGGQGTNREHQSYWNSDGPDPAFLIGRTGTLFAVCSDVPPGSVLKLTAIGVPAGHSGRSEIWRGHASEPSICPHQHLRSSGLQIAERVFLNTGDSPFSFTVPPAVDPQDAAANAARPLFFGMAKLHGTGDFTVISPTSHSYRTTMTGGVRLDSIVCPDDRCGGVCSSACNTTQLAPGYVMACEDSFCVSKRLPDDLSQNDPQNLLPTLVGASVIAVAAFAASVIVVRRSERAKAAEEVAFAERIRKETSAAMADEVAFASMMPAAPTSEVVVSLPALTTAASPGKAMVRSASVPLRHKRNRSRGRVDGAGRQRGAVDAPTQQADASTAAPGTPRRSAGRRRHGHDAGSAGSRVGRRRKA